MSQTHEFFGESAMPVEPFATVEERSHLIATGTALYDAVKNGDKFDKHVQVTDLGTTVEFSAGSFSVKVEADVDELTVEVQHYRYTQDGRSVVSHAYDISPSAGNYIKSHWEEAPFGEMCLRRAQVQSAPAVELTGSLYAGLVENVLTPLHDRRISS